MMQSPGLGIHFFFEVPVTLKNRKELKAFLARQLKKEKRGLASLNFIFCSDKKLLQINKEYLRHDYFTDIITFELSDPDAPIEGDIFISVDRVRDNATMQDETIKRELHRVIFHGALHLCGYSDKTRQESAEMRKMEEKWLKTYFE